MSLISFLQALAFSSLYTVTQKGTEAQLSLSGDIEKPFRFVLLSSITISTKKLCRSDKITNFCSILGDIDEAHIQALPDSYQNYWERYTRRMVQVYLSPDTSREGGTNAFPLYKIHGIKLQGDGYYMIKLDG